MAAATETAEPGVKRLATNTSTQSPTRPRRNSLDVTHYGSYGSNLSPLSPASPSGRKKDSFEMKHRPTTSSNLSPVARTKTGGSLVAPDVLEPSLLRCVTTSTLLQRCATSFRSQEFMDQNYSFSYETENIGDFISHDWASSRMGKLFALCLVYNSFAAVVASTAAAVLLCYGQYGEDPFLITYKPDLLSENPHPRAQRAANYGHWCIIVAPMVFSVFFLFWQDMRYVLRIGTRTCFLDKYCIDQANPERKAAGILGLAGFLRCSDRIIILWTPRYFTRLWCTYEVASWLHLQKPLTSVLFMPLAHANIIVTIMVAGWISFLMLAFFASLFPQFYLFLVVAGLLGGFVCGAHQARHSAAHLRALSQQLQSFSVTSSECFCCTVGHWSGEEEIPCDREVVYTTIAEWFNESKDDAWLNEEAALERFDRAVRLHFAAQVLQKAGPTQLSYRYVLLVGWPYMFRVFDVISGGLYIDGFFIRNATIMYLTISLAGAPLWYRGVMYLSCLMDSKVGMVQHRCLDYALSLALGFSWVAAALCIYLPLELLATTSESAVPMAVISTTLIILSGLVYRTEMTELCPCRHRSTRRHPLFKEPSKTDSTLPVQITDAIPFDMMDEGVPVPPPVLHKLRAVRITQDDASEGGQDLEEDASSTRSI